MASHRQSDRAFGLMFAIVFAVIAGLVWFASGVVNVGLIVTAGAFAFIALAWPVLLLPLNRLWQQLVHGVGFITNHLVLGVLLYVLITPISLFMRIAGHNPMAPEYEPEAESYFTAVKRQASAETFPDMF